MKSMKKLHLNDLFCYPDTVLLRILIFDRYPEDQTVTLNNVSLIVSALVRCSQSILSLTLQNGCWMILHTFMMKSSPVTLPVCSDKT